MSTRELVLRALIAAENGISGGELARDLNISRNAVWKAIEQLRGEGYEISACPGKGYIMAAEQNIISAEQIGRHLFPGAIEWDMEIHSHIDSTNNRGKELALSGAKHGTVIIADSQSAGRGRFGRKFHSPEGSGV
ncbi:MAG: HTH domain-containing protein, partial [Clostridia bacterium]|nr:HTH domain-containing protein [Clostridia bacterium]